MNSNEVKLLEQFQRDNLLQCSNKELAKYLNIGTRQIERYLKHLVELSYISIKVIKFPKYGTWINQRKIYVINN